MRRPNVKNIRTRLTLWYVAVLAGILIVYVAAVFVFQYAILQRQMYHDEVQDMETVEGLLRFDSQGRLELRQDYFARSQNRLLVDRFMQVQDPAARTLYQSATLKGQPLGSEPFAGEGTESFNERTVTLRDGTHVFLISHAHPVDGQPVLIRLGYSLAPISNRMTQFFALLLFALPLALVAAAFAGHAIAKRALKPLDSMAARAESLTAENLGERLLIENAEDELGHMGRVLNHLLDRLQRAFDELQRFTADAAHELRTPLAGIRSLGELAIEQEYGKRDLRNAIGGMLEGTIRLNQTIDGLLILARTESQPTGATEELILLPHLVREILALLDVVTEERRITVVENVSTYREQPIRADRSFVRVALLNILHNALKFSPPGGSLLITYSTISTEGVESQQVCVQDDGPGICKGEHEKVLQRFFTSRDPATAKHSGAGLGLSIAKLAIERSHGIIFFDKTVASGACCCIELPVANQRS